eukprot:TRINITY_DN2520_c0_g1_i1.p2 TRINITY_DN2520_c0_g1~~TRINITY_DN2520_c0_g1_i1.p2  ORF type:complete len:413 (+),score=152.86 TRINITY_DN2520_c0_g1_i1:59-1240(+)
MRSGLTVLAAAGAMALQDGSEQFYRESSMQGASNATMQLHLMKDFAESTGAKCLDGSPGAFYFRKGSGSGANKWYVHHQGGGWCESLDDCLSRSKGTLGSSTTYPQTTVQASGYFSTSPSVNPLMYNWNSVFIRYCDGGSFSGNNASTTSYGGTELHWRGKHIREAVVATLKRDHGLNDATDAVISGCSAGGLATYLHTDQWCAVLPKAKCVGLPDSGFFLDYQSPKVPPTPLAQNTIPGNYHTGLAWVYYIQNATAGINADCIDAMHKKGMDGHMCMFAEHTSVYTKTPLFALQSEYDSWQAAHVLAPGESVQVLGDNITRIMKSNLFAHNARSGAFLDSCEHHCGAWNSITIDGDLSSVAIKKWYESLGRTGAKTLWDQGEPFPCKECCSP